MILVDSSVWIYYYHPSGPIKIQELIKEAIFNDLVAINGIIVVEILSGISKDSEYRAVESDFKGFHMLEITGDIFSKAASTGSFLRKRGITVPATDLIIAATAIENSAILYHIDKHFDLIAKHTKLKLKNLE